MNTQLLGKTSIANWKQIDIATLLRKAIWLAIVLISIAYSLVGSVDTLLLTQTDFQKWVYIYLNFLSFVLGTVAAAIIFYRKPTSWMAFLTSLMLVTFTATDNGIRFWYLLFTGKMFSLGAAGAAYSASLFFNVIYMGLLTTSLAYVLLTFPDGKMDSRGVRWLFGVLVAGQITLILLIGAICLADIFWQMGGSLSYGVYALLDIAKSILMIVLAAWQIYRVRRITDPIRRQQVKWIVWSLTGMTFFYAIGTMVGVLFSSGLYPMWAFLPTLVFTYGFIFTLFIAFLRYRLWDMNFMFNKALVYTSMTAILGALGFAGATMLDVFAEQYLMSESPLIGAFVILPLAVLYVPVRDGMQAIVDRHLKPEEVDFSSAIVEFAPDAQLMLTSQDILKILVKQTVEQLNISSAAIYLRREDGQLVQSEPADAEAPPLRLDDKTRGQLEKGNVVIPPEGSSYSLLIPLVISRAARPDFLGILAFGPRHSGEGYPTTVVKSLKKLGCDAGKAIYIAQLRERMGQSIIDRLAAIERGLSSLNKTANV